MKDTLSFIVSSIVEHPEDVQISEETIEGNCNLIISVNKEDIGKVIGKEGKVIRSIRNIMKIKAMKEGIRVNITIADTETGR